MFRIFSFSCLFSCFKVTLNGSKDDEKVLSLYTSEGGSAFPNVIVPQELSSEKHVYQVLQEPVPPFFTYWWRRICGFTFSEMMEFVGLRKVKSEGRPTSMKCKLEGNCSVLCLGWNHYLPVFAVGLRNDTVYFFDLQAEKWMDNIILKHDFMEGLVVLKWKPMGCPNDIAVGTSKGLCLWSLQCDNNVGSDRYSGAFMRFLYDEDMHGGTVSCIEWSPDGIYLASAREHSNNIYVWDVNVGSHVCVKRDGAAGSFSMAWSRDGSFLVSGGASTFVIWDTKTWSAQKWTCPSGIIQDICWHKSSLYFFVSVFGVAMYHNFQIKPDLEIRGLLIGDYAGSFGLPFEAKAMAWSPCGRRIAIAFKGKSLVGIVESSSMNKMYALGFIHGVDEDFGEAEVIEFKPYYKKGALLTIVWNCGKISFIPMLIGGEK